MCLIGVTQRSAALPASHCIEKHGGQDISQARSNALFLTFLKRRFTTNNAAFAHWVVYWNFHIITELQRRGTHGSFFCGQN
jgi:hypothetical protein